MYLFSDQITVWTSANEEKMRVSGREEGGDQLWEAHPSFHFSLHIFIQILFAIVVAI